MEDFFFISKNKSQDKFITSCQPYHVNLIHHCVKLPLQLFIFKTWCELLLFHTILDKYMTRARNNLTVENREDMAWEAIKTFS